MKTAETLSSILKKHYTHSERKVEMLTFMLCRVRTRMCTCTRAHTQTDRNADTTRHIVFSPLSQSHLNLGGCYLK